jgi:hypothetical protein
MEGSEESADSTLVRAQSSTKHTVDIVTNPVDEAELQSLRFVDLIDLTDNGVTNDVVLQVLKKLSNTAATLAGKDNVVALGILVSQQGPIGAFLRANLLEDSLNAILVHKSNLVIGRAGSTSTAELAKVDRGAIGSLSANSSALCNKQREH